MVGEPHIVIRSQHDLALSIYKNNSARFALYWREVGIITKLLGFFPILPLVTFLEEIFPFVRAPYLLSLNGLSPFGLILNNAE
jgi:hypothetical protein